MLGIRGERVESDKGIATRCNTFITSVVAYLIFRVRLFINLLYIHDYRDISRVLLSQLATLTIGWWIDINRIDLYHKGCD